MVRTLRFCMLLILALGFVVNGCGPKPIPEESILDTPDNHYAQGMREFKAGQMVAAVEEFQRATALDPDYPGGYIGMGLVLAEKGNFEEALKSVDRGIDKDNQFIDGYIVKGDILVK